MAKLLERLVIALMIVCVLIGVGAMSRPTGPIGSAIAQWRESRRIRAAYAARWPELLAAGTPFGNRSDSVVILEFADYQCPFCRQSENALASFRKVHPDLGMAFVHFPLEAVHPAAEPAALASICATKQGRFAAMHEHLMTTAAWQHDADWAREARAVGIADVPAFSRCLDDSATAAELARDIKLGEAFGVKATPTFITRSGSMEGFISSDSLLHLVGVRDTH